MEFNKSEYIRIVREHIKKHTCMNCQDMVKLCYQGAYGPGHLLKDKDAAYQYFLKEYEETEPEDGDIYEVVSRDYVRVNIAPYKNSGLPAVWLFRLFCLTDIQEEIIGQELFAQQLSVIRELVEVGECAFTIEDLENYLEEYEKQGGGAVHHSDVYRIEERPSYRLVSRQSVNLLPLLKLMAEQERLCKRTSVADWEIDCTGELVAMLKPDARDEILVLAIEGRAASGKSTVARQLAKIVDGTIIAMDDFFLPSVLRKPKRLRQIGGNVHYERILEEVIPNLREDEEFCYTAFDCSTMLPGEVIYVPVRKWRIVEGVYSLHPKLGDYADIKVFMDIDEDEQLDRIRNRNGREMLRRFKEEWIPMEEAYFHNFKITDKADIIIRV